MIVNSGEGLSRFLEIYEGLHFGWLCVLKVRDIGGRMYIVASIDNELFRIDILPSDGRRRCFARTRSFDIVCPPLREELRVIADPCLNRLSDHIRCREGGVYADADKRGKEIHNRRLIVRSPASLPNRKFQIYGVGLSKSGTTSLANIFGHYRAAHGFRYLETLQLIQNLEKGNIPLRKFQERLVLRDQLGRLEMDSTSCNFYYLDILIKFPSAKFIFTIRDCYSWTNSFINECLRSFLSGDAEERATLRVFSEVLLAIDHRIFESPESVSEHSPEVIEKLFGFWAKNNERVLRLLPSSRSLILRTEELSSKLDEVAKFAEVSVETLIREKSQSNQTSYQFNILKNVDSKLVANYEKMYTMALMGRFFPGVSFEDFLAKEKRNRSLQQAVWFSGSSRAEQTAFAKALTRRLMEGGSKTAYVVEDWNCVTPDRTPSLEDRWTCARNAISLAQERLREGVAFVVVDIHSPCSELWPYAGTERDVRKQFESFFYIHLLSKDPLVNALARYHPYRADVSLDLGELSMDDCLRCVTTLLTRKTSVRE